MGIEIERKFLLAGEAWRSNAEGIKYKQGYLVSGTGLTVRVRRAGNQGFLTIKSGRTGLSRQEYEYPIPVEDAEFMLNAMCRKPLIEKSRFKVKYGGNTWEIDEFEGDNKGLIIAEIELQSENQQFEKPDWIGREVTGDPRYFNASLVNYPFSVWKEDV